MKGESFSDAQNTDFVQRVKNHGARKSHSLNSSIWRPQHGTATALKTSYRDEEESTHVVFFTECKYVGCGSFKGTDAFSDI